MSSPFRVDRFPPSGSGVQGGLGLGPGGSGGTKKREKKKDGLIARSPCTVRSQIPDHWQPEPNATRVRVQVLFPFKLSIRPSSRNVLPPHQSPGPVQAFGSVQPIRARGMDDHDGAHVHATVCPI